MLASMVSPDTRGPAAGEPRHPDRRPTVIFSDSFAFIQRIQDIVRQDRNLPTIDHGILTSAALALVAEMPEATDKVIERALEMLVARNRTRRPS